MYRKVRLHPYEIFSDLVELPEFPELDKKNIGNQIFHYKTLDRPHQKGSSTDLFVQRNLQKAKCCYTDAEILSYSLSQISIEGLYTEFGVCMGRTVNFIAGMNPARLIHGFDSFKGLPESWEQGATKDTFGLKQKESYPHVLPNVVLHVGLFKDSLPCFVQEYKAPIAFIHIDSDLFSSAQTVFYYLGKQIRSGTVILFDEFFNYKNWGKA